MTATGAGRPEVVPSDVVVGGHRLRVRRAGSGRPVLLIHGIPTSSLLWRHVQQQLIPHADVIAVDLLGYGGSDKPDTPSPTLAVQADLLAELLQMWNLRDVVVVGHDIGGGVAQLLAVREPERISALLLVDSIAYDSFPEPTIARLADPGWDHRIQEIDLAAGLERSLRKGITTPDGAAATELAALYAAPFEGSAGRAAYLRAARALRTDDLLSEMPAVEALTIPVRLLWGENDPFQPVGYGERLAAALADATLTVVPDGRHFLPEDRPQAVVSATLELLDLQATESRRTP
jgi:pimeloyl-ACP methyl ester carboxylesterase